MVGHLSCLVGPGAIRRKNVKHTRSTEHSANERGTGGKAAGVPTDAHMTKPEIVNCPECGHRAEVKHTSEVWQLVCSNKVVACLCTPVVHTRAFAIAHCNLWAHENGGACRKTRPKPDVRPR